MKPGSNHNTHYHGEVLSHVPAGCENALDVGCGHGALLRKLAARCVHVTAIDCDKAALAKAAENFPANVTAIAGDVLGYYLVPASFDFVAAVASLHHLPLEAGLTRFRDLLRSGGELVVVGLYRSETIADVAWSALAWPVSWVMRAMHSNRDAGIVLKAPQESLREVRHAASRLLPGAVVKRRLLFRYTLTWRKPSAG